MAKYSCGIAGMQLLHDTLFTNLLTVSSGSYTEQVSARSHKVVLLVQAAYVTLVSTSKKKGAHTVDRLRADVAAALSAAPPGTAVPVNGTIASDTLDAHNLASVRALCARVGEVDHFV
jgi:hypothetical protein